VVCTGCHSHKLNGNGVTIFRAIEGKQDSRGCIEWHMAKVEGGVEKINRSSKGWNHFQAIRVSSGNFLIG